MDEELEGLWRRIVASRERLARVVAGRPYHAAMASLAAGLALAPARAWLAVGAAAIAAACLALVRLPVMSTVAAGAILLGAGIGAWRLDSIDHAARAAGPAGTQIAGRAVLLEHPRRSLFGSSAAVRLTTGRAANARVLARLNGHRSWPDAGRPGAILRVGGITSKPSSGGSFDWAAHLRRRGIAFELNLDTLRGTGERRRGLAGAVDSMRRRAEDALGANLPAGEAALARGMVLGEDEAISDFEREDFRRSGLAHVLAVSGQNVMLLCALALPLLGGIGAGPRARVAILLALIAVYVPLAGAGPSLQRAGVMGAAGLVAMGSGRVASRLYAFELAAVVTLAINPRISGDPGWQLSFAAVAGILILARPIQQALSGLPRLLAEGLAVTVAATVATAPLIAHDFGTVSLAGVLANIVALPLVAAIMWIGMIGCALAQVPSVAAPAIDLLAGANGLLIGLLRGVVRAFADAPGASVAIPLGSRAGLIIAYLVLGALVAAVQRLAVRTEPKATSAAAAWRRLPSRRRAALVAAAGALALCGWRYATGVPAPPAALTVSFLDVGQGDATLIQDGAGASVLFDGGPPEARAYRQLRRAGVGRLDLMVSTHQSRDHQGGLHEVLRRIPVRAMVENGYGTTDPDYRRLLAEAQARGVPVTSARAGEVLRVGRLTIRVLGPRPRAPGEPPPDDPNPVGVAAIVSEGDFDLWLSADAESDAILQYPLRPVEAMKVSHHGSADPGLREVLRRLHPQVAAIEVGEGNSYGHPTPETLAALRAAVPHVYRTDKDGTVTLTVPSSGTASVDTAR